MEAAVGIRSGDFHPSVKLMNGYVDEKIADRQSNSQESVFG